MRMTVPCGAPSHDQLLFSLFSQKRVAVTVRLAPRRRVAQQVSKAPDGFDRNVSRDPLERLAQSRYARLDRVARSVAVEVGKCGFNAGFLHHRSIAANKQREELQLPGAKVEWFAGTADLASGRINFQ